MTHSRPALVPMLLEPALHTRVWGGRRLADLMGKHLPTPDPYGESWELHDSVHISGGPFAGRTLAALVEEYGAALIGSGNDPSQGLPLLAKFIDAADWLSVQVHPDDAQAAELEGEPRGKTEAWIVLAAEPGAQIITGVWPGTNRDAMAQAIRDNTLESHLIYTNVKAGDVLYIRAGTVHAIGPGLLIYEIKQSSDTTYRLYDWGRMGLDGKPRPMHIDKGVHVSNVDTLPEITHPGPEDASAVRLVHGPYFTTVRHRLDEVNRPSPILDTRERRFHALTCIRGTVHIHAANTDTRLALSTGQTAIIPASVGRYTLGGEGDVLRSWQGD